MSDQRHIAEPSHLAQLRKFLPRYKDLTPESRAQFIRALDNTEHFVFTAVPDADKEIVASATAMHEAGVWRLPYPICTFEFSARLSMQRVEKFDGQVFRFIVVCATHTDGEPAITGAFIKCGDGSWVLSRWQHWDKETGTMVPQPYYQVRPREFVMPMELETTDEPVVDFAFQTDQEQTDIINAVSSCLVMLATRGIRREKWVGNKPLLKHRPVPQNAYTRVMVREAAEEGHGSTVAGERYQVRLHLRRGHIRHQPVGPGRKFTRPIWIEPCLVGYAEEGEVRHEHYEAFPS